MSFQPEDRKLRNRPVSTIGLSLKFEDSGARPRSQEIAFVPVIREDDEEDSSLRNSNQTEKQLRRRTRSVFFKRRDKNPFSFF